MGYPPDLRQPESEDKKMAAILQNKDYTGKAVLYMAIVLSGGFDPVSNPSSVRKPWRRGRASAGFGTWMS